MDQLEHSRRDQGRPSAAVYSLVVPIYRNEGNIPALGDALKGIHATLDDMFEVVFVVDGSPDRSGEVLRDLCPTLPFPTKLVFHSRNFGSFTAIRTGLEMATGRYFAVMAADLQEPPELISSFFGILRADTADVVFGRRVGRNDSLLGDLLSRTFWSIYKTFVISDIPKGGVDIFGCNQLAREALLQISEPNSSLVAQLFWIGFRREFVDYSRRKREVGRSSWSLSRRMRYMMDSIFSYSDLPITVTLWMGILGCGFSLLFGAYVLIARLLGYIDEPGYTTLVLLIVAFGSMSLTVQGVIGSYLWRTFENTKRRPLRVLGGILEFPGRSDAG